MQQNKLGGYFANDFYTITCKRGFKIRLIALKMNQSIRDSTLNSTQSQYLKNKPGVVVGIWSTRDFDQPGFGQLGL